MGSLNNSTCHQTKTNQKNIVEENNRISDHHLIDFVRIILDHLLYVAVIENWNKRIKRYMIIFVIYLTYTYHIFVFCLMSYICLVIVFFVLSKVINRSYSFHY